MSFLRLIVREEVYVNEDTKTATETVSVDNHYYTVEYLFVRGMDPKINIRRGDNSGTRLFTAYGYEFERVVEINSTDRMLLAKIKAMSWLAKQLHMRLDLDDIIDRYLVN